MTADKSRENRLRRLADRNGFRLRKGRVGKYFNADNYGEYMLVDLETSVAPIGWNYDWTRSKNSYAIKWSYVMGGQERKNYNGHAVEKILADRMQALTTGQAPKYLTLDEQLARAAAS